MMGGFLNALFIILKFIVEFVVKPNLVNLFNKIYKYEVYDSFNKSKIKTGIDTNSNLTKMKNIFMDSSIFPDMNNSKFKITQLDNNLKFEIKRSDLISENGNEFILQLIRKKRNKVYHAKMSNFKKIFRCFLTGNNDKQINFYKMIETKLKKLISFEHFIKVTKNVKVFREIFLENHQNQIIKMSQAPRSKKVSESMDTEKISENLVKGINEEKLKGETNTAKVDTKLFEILLG